RAGRPGPPRGLEHSPRLAGEPGRDPALPGRGPHHGGAGPPRRPAREPPPPAPEPASRGTPGDRRPLLRARRDRAPARASPRSPMRYPSDSSGPSDPSQPNDQSKPTPPTHPTEPGEPADWLQFLQAAETRGVEGLGRKALALERLLAIGRDLATLDLDTVLDRILSHVLDLSGTRRGAVLLLTEEGDLRPARAADRSGAQLAGESFAWSRAAVEQALATGRVVAVEDLPASRHRDRTSVLALGLQAVVAIPLRTEIETLGVLYLDTDAAEHAVARPDAALLAAFGAQAAVALGNARRYRKLEDEVHLLKRALPDAFRFDRILYRSAAMDRVCRSIRQVMDTDLTVLIQGETGTGKELVARAIHGSGPRQAGRFLAENVGALPDELLESELFGHRRGAFSGAVEHKEGIFEAAGGGTVLLDEIGEASPALQVRLLRFLETETFRR